MFIGFRSLDGQASEDPEAIIPLRTFLAATQLSTDVEVEEEGDEKKPKVTISTSQPAHLPHSAGLRKQ